MINLSEADVSSFDGIEKIEFVFDVSDAESYETVFMTNGVYFSAGDETA